MTQDFQEALSSYETFYPDSPFFETWVPRQKFLTATCDADGNMAISREDDGIYGIAFGEKPLIPATWKNFSMESRGITELPAEYKAVAEWDCYWAPTVEGQVVNGAPSDDVEIEKFLKAHAPDSSVFPGNDEILRWVEVRKEGELVAVAALCRWESGRVVISSVATHTDFRGQGIGKELIQRCLITGREIGEIYLCLGVRHSNQSAQRLYQAAGFTLMHNFTYCERR